LAIQAFHFDLLADILISIIHISLRTARYQCMYLEMSLSP